MTPPAKNIPAVRKLDGSTVSRPTGTEFDGIELAKPKKRESESPASMRLSKGGHVFGPGGGHGRVFIVRSGCVRLFKVLADGRSVNLGLLGPNTVFTQESHVTGIASGAYAVAVVESLVSVVRPADLAALIIRSPELAEGMVAGMSQRLTDMQMLVEHLLVRDASVRLAALLISLASSFGHPMDNGLTAISLPLSHRELAEMIGLNRVTVSRKLAGFQNEGLVRPLGRNSLAVRTLELREYVAAAHANGNSIAGKSR